MKLQKDEKYLAAAKWYAKIIESNSPSTEILDYWWSGACYFYAKDYVTADLKYKEMAWEIKLKGYYMLVKK